MHPESVEDLFEEGIFANKGGLSLKTLAAVSSGEQPHRQRQSVADGDGGIVGDNAEKLLPEALLYLLKVGRLPAEGGAMHPQEVRVEEVSVVVASEVHQELRIFVP
jgi:hypothetical protein